MKLLRCKVLLPILCSLAVLLSIFGSVMVSGSQTMPWRDGEELTELDKIHVIVTEGTVVEAMPGATFKVQIAGGHVVTAYLSGKLWKNFIHIYEGDTVKLEMSPYDLSKGRIIWRSK